MVFWLESGVSRTLCRRFVQRRGSGTRTLSTFAASEWGLPYATCVVPMPPSKISPQKISMHVDKDPTPPVFQRGYYRCGRGVSFTNAANKFIVPYLGTAAVQSNVARASLRLNRFGTFSPDKMFWQSCSRRQVRRRFILLDALRREVTATYIYIYIYIYMIYICRKKKAAATSLLIDRVPSRSWWMASQCSTRRFTLDPESAAYSIIRMVTSLP